MYRRRNIAPIIALAIAIALATTSCATVFDTDTARNQGFHRVNDGTPSTGNTFVQDRDACFNEVRPMGIQDPVVWNYHVKRCLRIKGWRK